MSPVSPRPTRAELVRQRRAQENARRQQAVITRVQHRASDEKESGQVLRKPRRYQVAAMAVPQVRPQAPSLPHLRPGWRLLSGTLIVLIVYGLYLAWTSPLFLASNATVVGAQRIPAEEINAALRLNGVPIFLIAPQVLEASLLRAFPEIESVSVRVTLPAQVSISLRERQPVIAWIENNAMTWVDAEGFAFRPRGEMPGLITVVAAGRPALLPDDPQGRFLPPNLVRALMEVSPHLPPSTPILYDPQYGLGWNDARGWRAYIGLNTEDLTLKLHIYETLINDLTRRGIRPTLVSVAYPNALIYRLEP